MKKGPGFLRGPIFLTWRRVVGSLAARRALPDIRVNAADPGYTATDLNGHSGPQTVTEGTDAIVGLATEKPGAGSGRFVDRTGEIAWS